MCLRAGYVGLFACAIIYIQGPIAQLIALMKSLIAAWKWWHFLAFEMIPFRFIGIYKGTISSIIAFFFVFVCVNQRNH